MTTNRRLNILAGLLTTSPISQFWQLGNLTDVDPEIPNLPLEAAPLAVTPSEFWSPVTTTRLVQRLKPSTLAPAWVPQEIAFVAPATPDFGWYMPWQAAKLQTRRNTLQAQVWVPQDTPAPSFGWYNTNVIFPLKARARALPQQSFTPQPFDPLPIGWLNPVQAPRKVSKPLVFQPSQSFVPQDFTAQNFGWYAPAIISRKAKLLPFTPQQSFIQQDYSIAAPAPAFGWYVPFIYNSVKNIHKTTLAATPFFFELIPSPFCGHLFPSNPTTTALRPSTTSQAALINSVTAASRLSPITRSQARLAANTPGNTAKLTPKEGC